MSISRRSIVLTGFMGSGKSTIARHLARKLGLPVIDLDDLIVERSGKTIGEMIDQEGEPAFRTVESALLSEALANESRCVIALGGGTWAFDGNRALIADHDCLTVWLDAPFDVCWRRIRVNDARPLARDREKASLLFHERLAAYRLADLHIVVDGRKRARDVVEEIVSQVAR